MNVYRAFLFLSYARLACGILLLVVHTQSNERNMRVNERKRNRHATGRLACEEA